MLLRHAIGSALRRLRMQRGLTLKQLSERSRVSLPYLSEVERGRKEVSSEILSTICFVLEVSVPELLRETDVEFAGEMGSVLDIRSRVGARDDPLAGTHELAGAREGARGPRGAAEASVRLASVLLAA